MHEMPVDIDERRAIWLLVDQMIIPYFVVKRARFHGCILGRNDFGNFTDIARSRASTVALAASRGLSKAFHALERRESQ